MLENIRILLVDDHAIMRSSLGMLLESYGAQIAGEAATGEEAITKALALRPDVILMDITLPGMDGVEATRRITTKWSDAHVLALTMHAEEVYLSPFLEAGGAGYIRKSAADRDVLDAIQKVVQGQTILDTQSVQDLLKHGRKSAEAQDALASLSKRERDVLVRVARGFTSSEIGEQLNISPRTVDTYRARIMQKLGLEHRHQLVEYAVKNRLLD